MSRAPSRTPRNRDVVEAPDESDRFESAPHPRETFELFGHQAAEQVLLTAFREGRLAQSWILGGREGIGKATLAWRFARFLLAYPDPRLPQVQKAVNLEVPADHPVSRRIASLAHSDVAVLRREWNTKDKQHFTEIRVDDARQMMSRFQQAAAEGGWRIAIIDCAEDLNRNTANALLKLIEEPPPRSLFLFVSHRPAQMLATIRSRSRLLAMSPLETPDVEKAIRGLGGEWWELEDDEVRAAALRSAGSVRDALRLLGGDSLKLMEQVETLLQALPTVDWKKVSQLAETVSKREATADYEAVVAAIYDWIDARIRIGAGAGGKTPAQLADYAQVWEKFARSARETDVYNLDRRALILALFTDLATAVQRAA